MLVLKKKVSVCVLFTNSPEIKALLELTSISKNDATEILKYMPKYVRYMHVDDFYLSRVLNKIVHNNVEKIFFIKNISLFKNYSDDVVKIILDYLKMYPKFIIETNKIAYNFKNRNLDTLLIRQEFELLDMHLKKTIKENTYFMMRLMKLALLLDLTILAEKCGSIIAMFIKDKPLTFIEYIFE
jgi:hypothetical protein